MTLRRLGYAAAQVSIGGGDVDYSVSMMLRRTDPKTGNGGGSGSTWEGSGDEVHEAKWMFAAGDWTLSIEGPAIETWSRDVTITAGETLNLGAVRLQVVDVWRVRVVDAEGKPTSGWVHIVCRATDGTMLHRRSLVAGPDGRAQVPAPGEDVQTVGVVAIAPNGEGKSTPLKLRAPFTEVEGNEIILTLGSGAE